MKLADDMDIWKKYHELREGGDTKLARCEQRAEKANLELHYLGRLFWQQHEILTTRRNDANVKFVERLRELGFEINKSDEVLFYPAVSPAIVTEIPNIHEKYDELIKRLQYLADEKEPTSLGIALREVLKVESETN